MNRLISLILAFCTLSGAALAQNVYVKAGTIGRFDYDTNGMRTRTPESTYATAVLQYPCNYDDGATCYDTSRSLNDGTVVDATWTNGAYVFNGTSAYITTPTEYKNQGYEAQSTLYGPQTGTLVVPPVAVCCPGRASAAAPD